MLKALLHSVRRHGGRRDHHPAARRTIVAAIVIGCALGGAAPALADSLVYVKSDIPYISATDGTDAHVVTNDQPEGGTWQWVSATSAGTVYVASTDGDVGVYAPGQPAQANPPDVPAYNNLDDFVVAPDGSSVAYMLLQGSNLDPSELRNNSYFKNVSSGSSGTELSEYWPTYADPTDLWLEGDQGQLDVNPGAATQQSTTPPSNVSDPLEVAKDANGLIVVYRDGGSIEDFSPGSCPAGFTCETSNSTLYFVQYDAQNNVIGECATTTAFPFQKLAINSSGTLAAFEEQDGIHEYGIGNLSDCSGFQNLGLVVPGGSSPGFTASANHDFPYVASSQGGQGGNQGGQSGRGGQGATSTKDKITAAKAVHSRVKVGGAVVLAVDLTASSPIRVQVLRYVPASGHGKHRRKAHYVVVGTIAKAGVYGANTIKLTKVAGHRLGRGTYEAEISAGGKAHTVRFSLIA